MFADKLRKSILQAAIQGKLSKQLPTDGDARQLLRDIQAEKSRLIKEKKIKAAPPLPPITADEIPFDIPQNWCWARLGDICQLITKGSSPKWQGINYTNKGVLFITSENVGWEILKLNTPKYVEEKFSILHPQSILQSGDILTNIVGASIGRTAEFNLKVLANINQAVAVIRLVDISLAKYIVKYLNSPTAYKIMMNQKVETARANISLTNIANFIIPLPPLAEQKRIAEKVSALLTEIAALAEDEKELAQLEKEFSRKIKASLLQAAIQGKLSKQLPTDGDARALLRDIQAEKLRLIKEKKIKPAPPLPPTSPDEIPFEIPANWTWARLGDICEMYTGNSISEHEKQAKYLGRAEGFDFIATKDISFENEVAYNNGVKIPFENNFKRAKENSVLLCIEGGSAGRKIALVNREVCFGNKLCNFTAYKFSNEYLYFYLQSPAFAKFFTAGVVGIIGGVGINKLKNFIVPLPPLAEQKRIVARLEELLKEIEF